MNAEFISNSTGWDAYVDSRPDASVYHRWAWGQVVEQTYGHKAYYLAAKEGGTLLGALPLVFMKSRIFGDFLVSTPFSSYGGVLANAPKGRNLLLERAVELAQELGARHLELRQGDKSEIAWKETSAKVRMEVELPGNVEELWKRLSTGMRNKIRNAQKNKLEIAWHGGEAIDEFYGVFAKNMRDLGTPVYPRSWFENLFRQFTDQVCIIIVRDGGKAVAAGFVTLFRDVVEFPWSASLRESRKKYSAVAMYWALLEWATKNGYRRVDLGRCTPGSGTYEFKRHWPCNEIPLRWYYWLSPGADLPELRPENPRYRWATQIWCKLPVPVANWLGPRIVRAIP
jgi:FemAB-related protein (PEP-CTERM system-associated)